MGIATTLRTVLFSMLLFIAIEQTFPTGEFHPPAVFLVFGGGAWCRRCCARGSALLKPMIAAMLFRRAQRIFHSEGGTRNIADLGLLLQGVGPSNWVVGALARSLQSSSPSPCEVVL